MNFTVILYQPEIPPNTGNIIRLCANTGCQLALIKPLGFALDDKKLRRAGLDYSEFVNVKVYDDLASCCEELQLSRIFACTTKATQLYTEVEYQVGDALLLGPETRGLPQSVRDDCGPEFCIRIPMLARSRSLNLSNSAAVILYEAIRQAASTVTLE